MQWQLHLFLDANGNINDALAVHLQKQFYHYDVIFFDGKVQAISPKAVCVQYLRLILNVGVGRDQLLGELIVATEDSAPQLSRRLVLLVPKSVPGLQIHMLFQYRECSIGATIMIVGRIELMNFLQVVINIKLLLIILVHNLHHGLIELKLLIGIVLPLPQQLDIVKFVLRHRIMILVNHYLFFIY